MIRRRRSTVRRRVRAYSMIGARPLSPAQLRRRLVHRLGSEGVS